MNAKRVNILLLHDLFHDVGKDASHTVIRLCISRATGM